MKYTPYPYQKWIFDTIIDRLKNYRTVFYQLATGGGKTVIFSELTKYAYKNNKRVWIVVPRNELLKQASNHLFDYDIPHGLISAGTSESIAFKVHIVSKDTLIRRYEKIKNWPDWLIFDEGHLYLDRQIEIVSHLPETSKVIGTSATPERLDGRGLNELYEVLISGPPIKWLVERNYLCNIRYFCLPIVGIDQLSHTGHEYNQEEVTELLKKRKVFGESVSHYLKHAKGKRTIVFCRSVVDSEIIAKKFQEVGINFKAIDGKTPAKERKLLIEALRSGEIDGLTSCDLLTYGLDIKEIECAIILRPTMSRSVFFQMIGRPLRAGKKECIIFDHVGNIAEHGHPLTHYKWRFDSETKKKRKKKTLPPLQICSSCFLYFEGAVCPNCKTKRENIPTGELEELDVELAEVKPIKLAERPVEEKREFYQNINRKIQEYKQDKGTAPIVDLLEIAEKLKRKPTWVYWKLSEDMTQVNIPVLAEIARQKGYKPGWVQFTANKIRERL